MPDAEAEAQDEAEEEPDAQAEAQDQADEEPEAQDEPEVQDGAEEEPEAQDEAQDEPEEGLSEEEERQLERLKTEAIQQVVPVGFPLTEDAALEQAGHRRVQVGDTTLTINMILSQLRGDDWRTGLDFQDAIERAWDDIQEAYL